MGGYIPFGYIPRYIPRDNIYQFIPIYNNDNVGHIHNGLSPKKQLDNRPRHKVRMARQLRTIINISKQATSTPTRNIADTPPIPDFTSHNKIITEINTKTGINIPTLTHWSTEWTSDAIM